MKKVILLFIIVILLTGCTSEVKKLNINKKIKEKAPICLKGSDCSSLEDDSPKRLVPVNNNTDNNNEESANVADMNDYQQEDTNIGDENISDDSETNESEESEESNNDSETNESEDNNENQEDENQENNNEEDGDNSDDSGSESGTYLSFGQVDYEYSTIEILINSNLVVAGFQFDLESINDQLVAIGAFGGLVDEYDIDIMVGEGTNIILGFSTVGNSIETANGVLTNLSFDTLSIENTELCLTDIIISDIDSNNINTVEELCTILNY